MNPAEYGKATREELLAEYVEQADLLGARHLLFAQYQADQQREYWACYEESDGGSVTARTRDAERLTLPKSVYLMELSGEMAEISTRLSTIRLILGQSDTQT